MKVREFIDKLNLALNLKTHYQSGGWGKWNGSSWGFDCNNLGKAIIWGWNADTSKPRGGGAVYASNGLGDIGTETMIAKCSNVSSDFTNIKVGELLWMQGHVGYYIGNGQVIEASVGWNLNKVFKSQVDSKGNRTYNGRGGSAKWQKHGFMPWIDYNEDPIPEPKWTIGKYKILVSKTLRKSCSLVSSNRCKVGTIDSYTKSLLTSSNKNAIAMFKKGAVIDIHEVLNIGGRIWGRYWNVYIVLCNIDGTPQAEKVN